MDTGLTSDYIAALKEEAERTAADIVEGKCGSMEAYKRAVGYIQGLKHAELLLHDTIKHITERQEMDFD